MATAVAAAAANSQQQQQQHSSGTISPTHMSKQKLQLQSKLFQKQINAANAALMAAQQNQQKMLLHSALTRAVSHPQGNNNVVSLVNSLIENLGHRKLERTQSEPLPQVNTSR